MKDIGKQIIELRNKYNMTQEVLVEILGVYSIMKLTFLENFPN